MGRFKSNLFLKLSALVVTLFILLPSLAQGMAPRDAENGPSYCEQVVSIHGLLTRAQLQCGYEEYSDELIADSAKCIKHELGEKYGKKVLMFGMVEFDRNEKKIGHKKICANILKDFPEYVR